MEINRVLGNILGGVATEDMVEGRMVCLTSHSWDNDFGSLTDLPGFKLPSSAEEAKRAKFVLSFAEDNRPTPIIETIPSYPFALRAGGWDQATNVPFTARIRLTQPGHQTGQTVYSGTACLGYGNGSYTVKSGMYVSSESLTVPGSLLTVEYTGDDKGKLKYQATMDDSVVAVVEQYNSANGELTFTTLHF